VSECNIELNTILEKLDTILNMLAELEVGKKTRKKRKPSKYNIFIGKCMKEGKGMKECAAEYKRRKQG